jgi:peroxiredoxin
MVLLFPASAQGQAILQDDLAVTPKLQPLDRLVREQLATRLKECDAAESAHGRNSAEWFEANNRHDPLTVHGSRVLEYAREHPGTPESLICLSYIVDWSEGSSSLCQLACAELLATHKDEPALSWLCTRCTNALFLEAMEDFLTRLMEASTTSTVQAAAALNLAHLYDNAGAMRHNLTNLRRNFENAGMFKADPSLRRSFDVLESRSPAALAARRDELLKLIVLKYPDQKPWEADRTFGRLNFTFREAKSQTTYRELADQLAYEVRNLRVGCVAPDFQGTDIDSRPVSLAEHRGKPVLLMFSFKGCGACESMYPALRRLQKQHSADEFLLLGVMADETVDTVRQAVTAGDITWRCVWDGRFGPISKIYHPQSYPTVLLLDRDGRIVSTSLRREDLLPAVASLVQKPRPR